MYHWEAFQAWMDYMAVDSSVNYTDEIQRLNAYMISQWKGFWLAD
jgi:hypothetical protein